VSDACPLRDCTWRNDRPWQEQHNRLLDHLRTDHLYELQLMVAGADGGQGEPVMASVMQHIDARQVQGAADLVASVLVPQMRASLARKLASQNLRPVDPWPAVQVRRYRWAEQYMERHPDAPGGMRPAGEDEDPDLWQLELSTEAVPDRRLLEL
jgi:hypothetical protein